MLRSLQTRMPACRLTAKNNQLTASFTESSGHARTSFRIRSRYLTGITILMQRRYLLLTQAIEAILAKFIAIQSEGDKGNHGSRRKRDEKVTISENEQNYFFPKYLTDRNLFNLELSNPILSSTGSAANGDSTPVSSEWPDS
jgi:hypothetical protein